MCKISVSVCVCMRVPVCKLYLSVTLPVDMVLLFFVCSPVIQA